MAVFVGLANQAAALSAASPARSRFLHPARPHLREKPFTPQRLVLVVLGAPPAIGHRHFLRLAPGIALTIGLAAWLRQPAAVLNIFFQRVAFLPPRFTGFCHIDSVSQSLFEPKHGTADGPCQ